MEIKLTGEVAHPGSSNKGLRLEGFSVTAAEGDQGAMMSDLVAGIMTMCQTLVRFG